MQNAILIAKVKNQIAFEKLHEEILYYLYFDIKFI